MKVGESIAIIKALADNSRLMLMNALIERPQYVEELSERLDLAASTVSFHLKKLEKAKLVYKIKEQYYVMYHANRDALTLTLEDLIAVDDIAKTVQDDRLKQYRQKVIRAFFQNGKLVRMPAQQKKRQIILEEFVKLFEAGRTYTEKEVNETITQLYDDYCWIRRELVERKLMARQNQQYWLVAKMHESPRKPEQGHDVSQKGHGMDRRKALIREYKQNPPPAGVYRITNRANGKILVGKGMNVQAKLNSHQAQLNMRCHRNKTLQQDWDRYGIEQFTFEVLDVLEFQNESPQKQQEELAALEELWLDKLQPYGEQGYNRKQRKKIEHRVD